MTERTGVRTRAARPCAPHSRVSTRLSVMLRIRLVIAATVDPVLARLLADDTRFETRIQPTRTEDELAAAIGDAEVLVTRAYNKVSRRVLESAPSLRVIAQGTSGTDNIDTAAAKNQGIDIISLPGENANAVAELVIAFMIMMTRTLPHYQQEIRDRIWNRDDCMTRHELAHYLLGIVGLGFVGTKVARLAAGFGMRVQAYDPYITDQDFRARGARRVHSLSELLESSGIVSLHVPLTDETRRFVGASQIATMPRGSYLINAARGEVLDQSSALNALREEHLAGLALDVLEHEPPIEPLPDDPRLIVTPHIGGCSHECRAEIARKLYERIVDWAERN